MKEKNIELIYAGFFTRLLATLVDLFIVSFILSIVRFAIDTKSIVLLVVVWWLYTTVMLIKWRTTIGGKLFGIEILNREQEALSFMAASLRFIVSITPFLLYILVRGMQHNMELAPSPTVQQLPQLLFFLPPFLMYFTQKKQMIHDLLVHSIVVDKSEVKRVEQGGKKSVGYLGQKILRIGGTLIFLTLIGYLVLYVSVFYTIGKQSYDANNASYEKKYTVNDYNDSRIIFYNEELEKHSKEFVEAKSMIEIFESDVKKDLALNCIQYYLKEHNDTNWINTGSNFRKNARNKYATTKDQVKNAKRNESYMGKNFYVYELNDVNDIEDDIANVWGKKDTNKNTCDINMTAEKMYAFFLPQYLARYTTNLNRDILNNNKDLIDHRIKQEKWLKDIAKSSSLKIYEEFSKGNITLEEIVKEHNFIASLLTFDVVQEGGEFIVADAKRGIELWTKKDEGNITYIKTLTDNYRVIRIRKSESHLYIAAHGKKEGSYFLTFSYDNKTKTIKELDKVKIALSSKINDWYFFDSGEKVAMTYGYDKLTILDLSNPQNINTIYKSPYSSNNYSNDITVNEKTNTIYEVTRQGLNIFNINGDHISKVTLDRSFKGHQSLILNKKDSILYTLHITWGNGSFLHKYSLDDPYSPKLISSNVINIDFKGWNVLNSPFPENMKMYKNKFYISNKNKIYVLDKKMNIIKSIDTPDVKQFYFLENKIICACGKNGLLQIDYE